MTTYKLGNKAKCIIRSYTAGKIGEQTMTYANQPYTTIDDVEISINFASSSVEADGLKRFLSHEENLIDTIRLSNVSLTTKILNLIFSKSEELLCSVSKNYDSDSNKKIYLNFPTEKIYQVFVYDDEGELEAAYGELSSNELTVEKASSNYIIFYSYEGSTGYALNKDNNVYLKLDIQLVGNENEQTATSWIHIDKCALKINNSMYFSNRLNAVNLEFKVIDQDDKDYIVL